MAHFEKYEKGTVVEIIGNCNNHGFKMGAFVEVADVWNYTWNQGWVATRGHLYKMRLLNGNKVGACAVRHIDTRPVVR